MIQQVRQTNNYIYCLCPKHKDTKPSLVIAKTGPFAGCFRCFGCGYTGNTVDLGLEIKVKPTYRVQQDWNGLQKHYQSRLNLSQFRLDREWRVSKDMINTLNCGFDGESFTIPMRNEFNEIIGIQRRFLSGRKVCVEGSRLGLFVPTLPQVPAKGSSSIVGNAGGPKSHSVVFITEGVSDLAVLLDLGFYGIGRPSCNTGEGLIGKWLAQNYYESPVAIVIIADKDASGLTGANKLLKFLLTKGWHCDTIVPDAKDLRQFRDKVGKDKCKEWLLGVTK